MFTGTGECAAHARYTTEKILRKPPWAFTSHRPVDQSSSVMYPESGGSWFRSILISSSSFTSSLEKRPPCTQKICAQRYGDFQCVWSDDARIEALTGCRNASPESVEMHTPSKITKPHDKTETKVELPNERHSGSTPQGVLKAGPSLKFEALRCGLPMATKSSEHSARDLVRDHVPEWEVAEGLREKVVEAVVELLRDLRPPSTRT